MDYEKLRIVLREFFDKKPYIPTYEFEPLTDRVLELVKGQLESKAPKEDERGEQLLPPQE
jgi:hypothetical protein